ncbi:hypothetical protein HAX54_027496 [Datura stramonium]|uniref:Uncharacterized protein n=1 Tax=Datura stramonium TaxID=4076 RepID=A0ABS8V2W3_DATST|nr:hypothetical protein [Datura stramonium]
MIGEGKSKKRVESKSGIDSFNDDDRPIPPSKVDPAELEESELSSIDGTLTSGVTTRYPPTGKGELIGAIHASSVTLKSYSTQD